MQVKRGIIETRGQRTYKGPVRTY